jgi:hypothetical protein
LYIKIASDQQRYPWIVGLSNQIEVFKILWNRTYGTHWENVIENVIDGGELWGDIETTDS